LSDQKHYTAKDFIVKNNIGRRVGSALIATAAVGGLAIGLTGTASADPGTAKTVRYTVYNDSKGPIKFKTIIPGTEQPVQAPPENVTIDQGKSAWFEVKVFPKAGQHTTSAYFESSKGDHYWGVDMMATDSSSAAECASTNSSCSPKSWTKTTTITLK
jgi:hypothetical protein